MALNLPVERAQAAEAANETPKTAPLSAASNFNVTVPKASLGREFLMSASIIPQSPAPTSTGLAGKIVRFELFHDGVDLYESSTGLVVTGDLPSRRLITTFPIIEQDAEKVVIDFNKGMRRVFTEIWYGSGSGRGGFNPSSLARTMELPQSRVFEVRGTDGQLLIRQSAQVRDRQFDSNLEERYEIRYFLTPYVASEMKSKENRPMDSRYVRFFETQPQLETTSGRAAGKIAKFDVTQPVPFYYSANTPPEYLEAVRDGILYWNRAFGKEVIKAEVAPAGVTAPDSQRNIVQWVPWDTAGYAYADILVDPRTGGSRHGQAYMTSTFAIGGKARARSLLRAMRSVIDAKEAKEPKDPKEPKHEVAVGERESDSHAGVGGSGLFSSSSLCQVDHYAFARQLAAGLESLLAEGKLDDAAALSAAQDYVRQVVAHEVGHVLGLRHNFAGSLAANVNAQELDSWFKSYVTNANTQVMSDKLTTSSVMEYTVLKSSIFVGSKIRTTKEALPYDKAAIQWGYYDSTEPRDKKMLFGTDDHVGRYGDLRRFDYGVEPVLAAYSGIAAQVRDLPNSIIETFIREKAPRDPRDRRPLTAVSLNASGYAASLAADYADMLLWFKSGTRSLRIENTFDYVGELNRKEIIQAHWKSLNEQFDKLTGVDRALFSFLPVDLKLELKGELKEVSTAEKIDAKKLNERLAKLLEAPAYTNWVGLDEKVYTFTKEEKDLIINRGKRFFEEFEKESVKSVLGVLEKAGRDIGVQATGAVAEDDVISKFEKRVIDLAKLVITAKDEDKRRRGKVDKSFVEVVEFKYDQDTRLAAARVLADPIGSFKAWSVDAKGDLNKQLKDDVEAALNVQNFKDFQDTILSKPLRDWYLNQQAILALLPPKRPAGAK